MQPLHLENIALLLSFQNVHIKVPRKRIPVTGINLDLDRIRFDAADRGRTDLGQHGHRYG